LKEEAASFKQEAEPLATHSQAEPGNERPGKCLAMIIYPVNGYKKIASYHQYFAVNKAVESTLRSAAIAERTSGVSRKPRTPETPIESGGWRHRLYYYSKVFPRNS
jgi:hypothetical protein